MTQELELDPRVVLIESRTQTLEDIVIGNERLGLTGLRDQMKQVSEFVDKRKFTIAIVTLALNSTGIIFTLILQVVQILSARGNVQ